MRKAKPEQEEPTAVQPERSSSAELINDGVTWSRDYRLGYCMYKVCKRLLKCCACVSYDTCFVMASFTRSNDNTVLDGKSYNQKIFNPSISKTKIITGLNIAPEHFSSLKPCKQHLTKTEVCEKFVLTLLSFSWKPIQSSLYRRLGSSVFSSCSCSHWFSASTHVRSRGLETSSTKRRRLTSDWCQWIQCWATRLTLSRWSIDFEQIQIRPLDFRPCEESAGIPVLSESYRLGSKCAYRSIWHPSS